MRRAGEKGTPGSVSSRVKAGKCATAQDVMNPMQLSIFILQDERQGQAGGEAEEVG